MCAGVWGQQGRGLHTRTCTCTRTRTGTEEDTQRGPRQSLGVDLCLQSQRESAVLVVAHFLPAVGTYFSLSGT